MLQYCHSGKTAGLDELHTERTAKGRSFMAKKNEAGAKAADGRIQALEAAIAQIEKAQGKGAVMRLGDAAPDMQVDAIPTGSLTLDIALGIGGIPRGRIVEIYGPESGGKTTLALHMIAEAQKAGGIAGFVDAEHALDPDYAARIGVDVDNLYVSQPDSGEDALNTVETLVRSGALDIIVVDSVAALTPKAEIDGDMGESHVGLLARLMSQAMRKLTGAVAQSRCVVVFINQIREKVGVMFGPTETTTGGRALKFYASVRLDIRRVETIKVGGIPVGNKVRVKVVKNKVAPPFQEAVFDIVFGNGVSKSGEVLDVGVAMGIVKRSGSWYEYAGERFANGREAAKAYLDGDKALMDRIEAEIRKTRLPEATALPEAATGAELDPFSPDSGVDDWEES